MMQWKYTSSRIPRFDWDVSKHNPYLYYPSRLLPILGYSDIPLVGGSRLSLLTIIILSHFYWRTQFPVTNPIKHGRNYFVRRLHYAAGEVRSYTLYFHMHRKVSLILIVLYRSPWARGHLSARSFSVAACQPAAGREIIWRASMADHLDIPWKNFGHQWDAAQVRERRSNPNLHAPPGVHWRPIRR